VKNSSKNIKYKKFISVIMIIKISWSWLLKSQNYDI
jgi:hypothetical protein